MDEFKRFLLSVLIAVIALTVLSWVVRLISGIVIGILNIALYAIVIGGVVYLIRRFILKK